MKPAFDSAKSILIGVALTGLICASVLAAETNDAARILANHIADTHRQVIVDTNRTQTAWSDEAILEVATNFPASVWQLISNPSRYQTSILTLIN